MQNNYNFLPPSNYCQLCKTSFQDYLEHTHSQQHSQQIAASIANHFIEELAGQFKPGCRKTKRIGRKKGGEKRMEKPPKQSCKMSGSNINNIAAKQGETDAKNSNHSTNLISSSGWNPFYIFFCNYLPWMSFEVNFLVGFSSFPIPLQLKKIAKPNELVSYTSRKENLQSCPHSLPSPLFFDTSISIYPNKNSNKNIESCQPMQMHDGTVDNSTYYILLRIINLFTFL